ncbi:putative porin [Mucilaginibacter koreensis]
MLKQLKHLLLFIPVLLLAQLASAQIPNQPYKTFPGQPQQALSDTANRKQSASESLDTLRKRQETKHDTVIFTSKFIKVTNERLLNDSTQVFPLDTGIRNFENYSPLYQPRHPYINLGNLGLPARPLLFEPYKGVGFDVGKHSLDVYMLNPEDIQYYRARVGYTNLYYVGGGLTEQYFKLVHSQNIKPNWNFGVNFNTIGSKGFYPRQNVGELSLAFFTWYESKNKRYNLLANVILNNMRVPENGSPVEPNVFTSSVQQFSSLSQPVRLNTSSERQTNNGFYIKQFYYLGHIDKKTGAADTSKVLPTQRVSYTFHYNARSYRFSQNEVDTYHVFPDYYFSPTVSRDSLTLNHLRNDFSYSFYLRPKAGGFVKNEVKLDLGLTQDIYSYHQYITDSLDLQTGYANQQREVQNKTFQNITLNAKLGYKFSDQVILNTDFRQVVQSAYNNFGDYLYDATLTLSGGNKAGRIIFGAYAQSNAAPLIFNRWISNHYIYTYGDNYFNKQKINNLSFNYINDNLQLDLKAEYFLINNYFYFEAQPGGIDAHPAQYKPAINLLKVSLGKTFQWRRWHLEDYIVYQKTDQQSLLRTPEVYNYASIYYTRLFFNVLNASIGANVRYNSTYYAPSYALSIGQFYNGPEVTFSSYPVASVFVKATLYRTNLFLMYDYVNQGLSSPGYYTVNRYPMGNHMLKFGVSWTFYN